MRVKLKKAVASGNWSNPAIWSNGVKPQPGDHVAANGYTITIDESVTVDAITKNIIYAQDAVATPIMTGSSSSQGQVIVSDINHFAVNNQPWRVFDGYYNSTGTFMQTLTYNFFNIDVWFGFEFTSPKIIDRYILIGNGASANSSPTQWLFEAWDGAQWVTLETVSNLTGANYTSGVVNSNSYISYRIKLLDVFSTNASAVATVNELRLYEAGVDIGANQGGQFILNDGVTLTCTNPDVGVYGTDNNIHNLIYNGSGSATINANIIENANTSNYSQILHSGTGTLNIIGTFRSRWPYMLSSAADYVYVQYNERYGRRLQTTAAGTTNIIGNIEYTGANIGSTYVSGLYIRGNHTLNITGNMLQVGPSANTQTYTLGCLLDISGGVLNITGDIILKPNIRSEIIAVISIGNVNTTITGTIRSEIELAVPAGVHYVNYVNAVNNTFSHIGILETQVDYWALVNGSSNVLTRMLLSGPFISSAYGHIPFTGRRINIIPTFNNYFTFANNENVGNVYPASSSNPYTLVSPDTIVDSPTPSDVRLGVSYASNNYIGTLAVPPSNKVSYGVPVDNTTGSAVLTPADVKAAVWDELVSNLTTPNSIGLRMSDVSTVATTGAQIANL